MDCLIAVDAVFAGGGHEAPDASLCRGAGLGTEGAGDLHLGLGRAQVALCLIVCERDGEVVGEAQHLGLPVAQAFQEVTTPIPAVPTGNDG